MLKKQTVAYVYVEVAILHDITKLYKLLSHYLERLHLIEMERKPPGANK